MVLASGSISAFGAIRDDEEEDDGTALVYTCEEGVWYKVVPNEHIRVKFVDDETHVVDFLICVMSYREDGTIYSAITESVVMFESDYTYFEIQEDVLDYRAAYMMEYDGVLYFAACVWDVNGDVQTYIWRENDTKTVCISGELEKEEGVISVREETIYGERITTMDMEKWIQQPGIYPDDIGPFTLSRPLLTAAEINLSSETEMLIIPAGTEVEIVDILEHDDYEWYCVQAGDDESWVPVEGEHLVLQDADFYDTFAPVGSDITYHETLNDSWVRVDTETEEASTYTDVSGWIYLSEVLPKAFADVDTHIYVSAAEPGVVNIGVIDFDESVADPFICVQFPIWLETPDDDLWTYAIYCRIYRIVGCWAMPVYADTTGGLYTEKLIDVDYFLELYLYDAAYDETPVQVLNGDGTIYIGDQLYELEGLNQLVPVEG